MIIANVECDEIVNQIVTSLSKRKWVVELYNENRIHPNNKRKDKRKLKKILKRARLEEGEDFELHQEIDYPELDSCLIALHTKLTSIRARTKCDKMVLWLGPDDGSNFRYKSATTLPYKGTRPPKPQILKDLRNYMIHVQGANVIYGYEADDALGINQVIDTHPLTGELVSTIHNITTIAVHCDKDIYMIPGSHYDTLRDEFVEVSDLGYLSMNNNKVKGTGLMFFYYQLLAGDRTDNIPSIRKGLGNGFAYNCVKDCKDEKELLEAVLTNYRLELALNDKDQSWKNRLLEQADLIWICRDKEEKGRDYISRKCKELLETSL